MTEFKKNPINTKIDDNKNNDNRIPFSFTRVVIITILMVIIFNLWMFFWKNKAFNEFDVIYKDIKEITKLDTELFLEVNSILSNVYPNSDIDNTTYTKKIIWNIVKEYSQDKYADYIYSTNNYIEEELNGKYEWIGVLLNENNWSNNIYINAVFEWSPAQKSDLKDWDKIKTINWERITDINKFKDIVKENSKNSIILELDRDWEIIKKEIKQDTIYYPSVYWDIITTNDNKNILFINIRLFWDNTYNEIINLISRFENIDWYIIDLMWNWGWELSSAEDILNIFIEEWKELYNVENLISNKKEISYSKKGEKKFKPMIILIDELSASASELLTLSLKNNFKDKVKIIGNKSYWKWTVQSIYELSNWDFLKFTIWLWSVWDVNINKKGIVPDIIIENYDNLSEKVLVNNILELIKE